MVNESIPRQQLGPEDYARAERFLPDNASRLVRNARVEPQWFDDGSRFWYRRETSTGTEFVVVVAASGHKAPAFDHTRLAAELSRATGTPYTAENLPFEKIELVSDLQTVRFELDRNAWEVDLNTYKCVVTTRAEPCDQVVASPDEAYVAFVRDHNLFLRCEETGEETPLTDDGEPEAGYALPIPSPIVRAGLQEEESKPDIFWSPDSRWLCSYRLDYREAGRLNMVQSKPHEGMRPRVFSYVYPLPGDDTVPTAKLYIFDVNDRSRTPINIDPLHVLYYGSPPHRIWWTQDGDDTPSLYVLFRERGYTSVTLYEIEPTTGDARLVIQETNDLGVDLRGTFHPPTPSMRVLGKSSELIWYSQQDGWGHIYLHDLKTGNLKRQLTSGQWTVHDVVHVDEEDRLVYFTAGGREPGIDPYYCQLYRVSLDGGEPELLTPEDAHHEVSFGPGGKCFVDRYSRVDLPPVAVLRSVDGRKITTIEEANINALEATGWKRPKRFSAKARDGKTDVYGVIIYPTDFDPSVSYPVVDGIYAGPHTNRAPVAFAGGEAGGQFWQDQALAELGFVVVNIDGLGMPLRSRAFARHSYKNLGDAGLPDHISALRQLAVEHTYLDLERVGIYGYSAGGYSSTHAILAHPEFYKVAVSWAGNHHHLLDKASWVERWMGLPVEDHYFEQANSAIAKNLQGKLLLMHGEMDENVPLAATLELVDALVEANKDFDLFILPNGIHRSGNHPYVTRRRWDYFVRHLRGAEPPTGYEIRR